MDNISEIITVIAVIHRMKVSVIKSNRKTRSIARVRHIAMICLRKHGLSYSEIGRALNKNHSTVILACRNADSSLTAEAVRTYERIKNYKPPDRESHNWDPRKGKWQKIFDVYAAECQVCGWEDIVAIHHIIAKKNGGSDKSDNILILCPNHHAMLHMGLLLLKDVPEKKILTGM